MAANGFFQVVIVLTFNSLPALISLAFCTVLAALFFAATMQYKQKWHELGNPLLWRYGLYAAFFISVLLYGLIFIGLKYTTPGNAAILNLLPVFTSFLFFNVLHREPISLDYKIGAALMVVGALIILAPSYGHINIGDLLIFLAMFCPPIGNFFQQKARQIASSETVLFARSVLAIPVLFLIAFAIGESVSFAQLQTALPYLLVNGLLILGLSKIFWIEGIHRIPVTKAEAICGASPFIALFLAWLILGQSPTIWQFASVIPLVLGVLLLTDRLKLRKL